MPTHFLLGQIDLAEPLKSCEERLRMELQRRYLEAALWRHCGHIGRAAQALGVSRRTVTAWVSYFKIDAEQYKTRDVRRDCIPAVDFEQKEVTNDSPDYLLQGRPRETGSR